MKPWLMETGILLPRRAGLQLHPSRIPTSLWVEPPGAAAIGLEAGAVAPGTVVGVVDGFGVGAVLAGIGAGDGVGVAAAGDGAGGGGGWGVAWSPFWAWPPYYYDPWLYSYDAAPDVLYLYPG